MLSMYFYLNSFLGILFAAQCSTTYTKEKTTFVNSYGLVIKFVAVTLALLTKQSLKRLFYKENAILTIKKIGILTGLSNLVLSFIGYFLYKSNTLQFQFVQQYDSLDLIIRNLPLDFFLGLDGSSIFFIILTGIIMPIAIISNWKSITDNSKSYILIMLLLEMLLITVFLVLDTLSFYIFFESILPPLFLLVGFFGSDNKVVAGYYLFLYTLLGSLFMLLSILTLSSLYGVSDYSALFKTKVAYISQTLLFVGIFIAFAVKTPTIFLNIWLLKAHVESPLGGSIILAAIVLKLSLYGIVRLILPILPKITLFFTSLVFSIAVITILYASVSTLRTVDIKELIAYSSVSHAAVYLLGMFSNTITGIKGAIILGLAHGFVSSGLFICVGGVLYDRSSTRLISSYKGMTQLMPLFSILFFILCLGNSGTPLTLNFIGEFMCLYGSFEKLPVAGAIACSSIVFSAAYTIYMYNRIAFGGSYSDIFKVNFIDLTKREFVLLTLLVVPTVILGIYPSCITDCLSFGLSSLIYNTPNFTLDNISSNIIYTAGLFGISTSKKLAKKFSNKRSFKSTAVNKINELPSPPSSTHSAVSGNSVNSDINTFTNIREFVQYHADRLDTRLADYVIEYGNLRIDPTTRASLDHYWNNITRQIETIIETIERLRDTGTGLSEARNMSRIIEDLYDDSQGGLQNILRQAMEEIARQSQAAASQAGPSQSDVSEAVSETVSEAVASNAGPSSILKEKFLKDNPFNKKDSSATQEVDQDDELYTSPLKRKRSSDDESDFEYEGKGKRPRNNNDGPNRGDGNSGSDGPSGPSTGGDSGASGGDIGSGGDMGSGGGTTSSRSIHDFSLDENEFLTDTDLYYFPTDFNLEQFIGYLDLNLFSKLLEILPSFTSVVYLL